jgi:hypothetical protein
MLEHPTIRACLGVFVGERPTAGFSVEVQKIEEKPGTLRVLVFETSPAPGSPAPQVLTQPHHIIRAERRELRVRLVCRFPQQCLLDQPR